MARDLSTFVPMSSQSNEKKAAVLLLADGTVFRGRSAGFQGTVSGEIAFNTGMTGYQEIFTDPSYHGQILVMTTAHIGNYGVSSMEVESGSVKISGAVIKKFSEIYSRPAGEMSLGDYFERDKVVAICDIDTRALIRHIRETGAMNAIISSEIEDIDELKKLLLETPGMEGLELSSLVTSEMFKSENEGGSLRIALIDFGVKENIIRCLTERGAEVGVFPMGTDLQEILLWNPDGIMLSNGPGDPGAMPIVVAKVKDLIETGIPMFGICLGHQIIALSVGLRTEKMFNGHRGVNHPVKNLLTGKCEVTSQNHGFVVSRDSLEHSTEAEETHVHLNDHTVAGIRLTRYPVFSVQYHPEASAGPHDSRYLFDQFIASVREHKAITV
jgi:carbamoyl-phosphate synthase small subunit